MIVQRNAHSSTIDALVLSGLRPTFVAPELDPALHIAHCMTPAALERALAETPGAVGATVVSPTYFGAVADIAALAEVAHAHGVPLIVDEAWGAHLAFHHALPRHALSLGADLVVSSTHKIVGSLTQAAMIHLGPRRPDRGGGGGPLRDPDRVHEPQLAPGGLARRGPPPRRGARPRAARRDAPRPGRHAAAVRELPGLDVLDERLAGAPGVFDYDPLRLAIDVRGTGHSGYALARIVRERDDVNLELAGENVMVAVFGMGEDVTAAGARLVAALRARRRCAERDARRTGRERAVRAPPAALGRAGDDPAGRVPRPPGGGAGARGGRPRGRRVAGRLPARDPQRAARASGSRPRRSTTSSRRSTTAAACAAPATAGSPRCAWRSSR